MKKIEWKKCQKMFLYLKPFFVHSRKLFSEFLYKCFVIALHGIIGFLQIIIQNYNV